MKPIAEIQSLLKEEMTIFEAKFKDAVKSQVSLLDRIMHYIIRRKGKQVRPMFVFLSAKMFEPVNDSTYRAAALVELLHTATLVHDDVVDEAFTRRGFFSINALWKNKIAVLVGDYLLSKGLLLSLENDDFEILKILSRAVKQMSEGELLQIEKSRTLNLSEDTYFEIIKNKTASLLASSCAAGCWSTTKNTEYTEKMRQFGERAGIAFQIKDDLFDYGSADVGKPTGNDIKEKKLTLPLIYTLNRVPESRKKEMIYILKNKHKTRTDIQFILEEVRSAGGLQYASDKMYQYRDLALEALTDCPQNEYTNGLKQLVNFTTDRKY
jgi:octaprenyl-diphosphate synthase